MSTSNSEDKIIELSNHILMLTEILSNSEITLGYGTITNKFDGRKIIPISVPMNTEQLEFLPRDSDWNHDIKLIVDFKDKHVIYRTLDVTLYTQKFKFLPNLKKLSIINCTNSTITYEFDGLSNIELKELVLANIPNTSLESIGNIKSLEILELRRLNNLNGISSIIEKLPKLKKLIISKCKKLGEEEFGNILCYCLENKIEYDDSLFY